MSPWDYPWDRVPKGASFFIPSIDPRQTLTDGLRAGIQQYRLRPRQVQGRMVRYKGAIGVMFKRV